MEGLLLDLRCTDGKGEILILLEKVTKIIQESSGDVKSLRFSNPSIIGHQDDATDDAEFLTYVANSFVTILLYYYEDDVDIFKSATNVLLALLSAFPILQAIVGHSGLYDNLSRFVKRQFLEENFLSFADIGHCCMQLLSAMTYGCHSNIDKCADVDLFHIVEQYLQAKFLSFEPYLVGLKLVSFLISDSAQSNNEGEHSNAYIPKIWRQQCLVKESRRHSLMVGVVTENRTVLARILQLMNSFLLDSDEIQEFGLKCLNILIMTDGACEDLWTEGAFDTTMHACYRYITSEQIQRLGFFLLKQLLFKSLCNEKLSKLASLSDTLYSKYDMLGRVLIGSLTAYSHCADILIPACDVIKSLVFVSELLAISMIHGGIPKVLFEIFVEMNGTANSNVDVLKNNILSCFRLFFANNKTCQLTAESFLTGDRHYAAVIICMMMFGADIYDTDCNNHSLLMKAYFHSQHCVVNCMLNVEHYFILHGVRRLNLEGVKCCVRNACSGVTLNVSVVALLLRFLMEHGDPSFIDWKEMGIRDMSGQMLSLIFNPEGENEQFSDHSKAANDLEDGFNLTQDVINAAWDPENFDKGLSDVLKNKYMQTVECLKESPANSFTMEQYNMPVFSLRCQCTTSEATIDRDGKKIEFEDHLHISFNNDESACYAQTQLEDSDLTISNVYCEKCAKLFNEKSGFMLSSEPETKDSVSGDMPSTMDIGNNLFRSLAFLGRSSTMVHIAQNLLKLTCRHNPISHISCDIAKLLCNIKKMKLDNACLARFPANLLLHCEHLVSLDISHNEIEDFSSDFLTEEHLHRNLSVLKMSHNNLKCFPFHVCSLLRNLTVLDLSNNSIKGLEGRKDASEWNSSFREISVSESVNLSSNEVEEISLSFLNKLSETKQLDFSKNLITDLVEDAEPGTVNSLHRINFSHNNFENFPTVLLQFKLLKVLNLSHNRLSSLPAESTPIAQLRDLDLSHNKIVEIGDFLRSVSGTWMHSLKILKFDNNQVEAAPSELGLLRNLEVLDLRENCLTQVTSQVGRLSKLYQLSLGGNQLDIDPKLIEGRTQELRSYFYSRLKSSEERLKANIILFSSSSTWKTALIKLLRNKHKMRKAKLKHHCGITLYDWRLETGKRNFSLMLFDISCDKVSLFKSYPQISIMDSALYIVISEDDSQTDMSAPLSAIQEFAPYCPVVHVNSEDSRSETGTQSTAFSSHIRQLNFECVAPETSHMQELTNCISAILNDFKIKGNPVFVSLVPKNYITLEEIFLEAREKLRTFPVLSYSSLIDLIQQHERLQLNLEDGDELLTAITFLTKFGVIWHQDDSRNNARNYFILDPLWLLDVFQQILAAAEEEMTVADNTEKKYLVPKKLMHGVAEIVLNIKSEFANVNSASKSFVPVLIRLMENRGLVYTVDDDTYFIPYFLDSLCPEPHHNADEYGNNFLIRLLQLDFMPVNFWHHVIAGIFNVCKHISDNLNLVCWENGVSVMSGTNHIFSIRQFYPQGKLWLSRTSLPTQGKSFVEVCVYQEGRQMLVLPVIMDHLNNTFEEWFPDLLEFDMCGQQHVIQYIPCMNCLTDDENGSVHLFALEDLIKIADEVVKSVTCPNHPNVCKDLDEIVPDVVLQDFKADSLLDPSLLEYKPEQECLLGEGGFGTVFRGKYAGQEVAVKSLRSGSSTPAYINLRNEMSILGHLSHPSIISLIGYILDLNDQPVTLLVMELAREGSLTNYLTSLEKLSTTDALVKFPRFMRLRVAKQVLEGVAFMHKHSFIYRDLKPDNVLVMTLDQNLPANVKLVDFGITVPSASSGTVGGCGSPGYSAPEVVSLKLRKKDGLWNRIPYTDKCDVFSFGLLLYEIAVCRTPWFMHSNSVSAASVLPNVPDEAVMKGVLPSSLTSFDVNMRWPHMQDIISSCLRRNPDDRPSAGPLLLLMRKPEICCFRNHIEIGNIQFGNQLSSVRTVKNFTDPAGSGPKVQICVALSKKMVVPSTSFDEKDGTQQTSYSNEKTSSVKLIQISSESVRVVEQTSCEIKNDISNVTAILCIPHKLSHGKEEPGEPGKKRVPRDNIVLVGTEKGKLFVVTLKTKKSVLMSDLRNTIQCLHFHERDHDASSPHHLIFAGLKNGDFAVFESHQLSTLKSCRPLHMIGLHQYHVSTSVQSITSNNDGIYACCSKHIARIGIKGRSSPTILQLKMLPRTSIKNLAACLQHITICRNNIFASCHSSCHVLCWKEESIFPVFDVDVLSFSMEGDQIPHTTSRITSLLSDENRNVLYVGLSTGHIMLFGCEHDQKKSNSDSLKIITIIQRHVGPVWNLSLVENCSRQQDMIVAFGIGFRSTSEDCIVGNSKVRSRSTSYEVLDDGRRSSCLTFYDANLPEIACDMENIEKQRENMEM